MNVLTDMTGKWNWWTNAMPWGSLSSDHWNWGCLLFLLLLELLVISPSLVEASQLHGGIAEVARKQKQISGLDHPSEPHEEAGVEKQSGRHACGDHGSRLCVEVKSACADQTPVSSRSPKVHSFWANRWVDKIDYSGHFYIIWMRLPRLFNNKIP